MEPADLPLEQPDPNGPRDPDVDLLDETLAGAEANDGLAGMDLSAAVGVVRAWRDRLTGGTNADLVGIAADLDALETELTSPGLDGAAIGELLVRLGTQTTLAATTANGLAGARLAILGRVLSAAGRGLAPDGPALGASDAG